jgi:hypothetical protein
MFPFIVFSASLIAFVLQVPSMWSAHSPSRLIALRWERKIIVPKRVYKPADGVSKDIRMVGKNPKVTPSGKEESLTS